MKKILVFLLCLGLTGCAGSPAWTSIQMSKTRNIAKINNEKMLNLKLGMTKQEVLDYMGSPDRSSAYTIDDRNIVFFFYRTAGWRGSSFYAVQDTDDQFTPLAIEDDKLIGWGRNFYDQTIKLQSDIKIKQE